MIETTGVALEVESGDLYSVEKVKEKFPGDDPSKIDFFLSIQDRNRNLVIRRKISLDDLYLLKALMTKAKEL